MATKFVGAEKEERRKKNRMFTLIDCYKESLIFKLPEIVSRILTKTGKCVSMLRN